MSRRFHRVAVAILTLVLAVGLASPALASPFDSDKSGQDEAKSVQVVVDVLVLRPLGLMMTALGTVFYAVPVAPLTLITRPSDIGKPFKLLVAAPAHYTFVDPLGEH